MPLPLSFRALNSIYPFFCLLFLASTELEKPLTSFSSEQNLQKCTLLTSFSWHHAYGASSPPHRPRSTDIGWQRTDPHKARFSAPHFPGLDPTYPCWFHIYITSLTIYYTKMLCIFRLPEAFFVFSDGLVVEIAIGGGIEGRLEVGEGVLIECAFLIPIGQGLTV